MDQGSLDTRLQAFMVYAPEASVRMALAELAMGYQALAHRLYGLALESRETSLAFTALEESWLWAQQSLVRQDPRRGDTACPWPQTSNG